MRAPIKTQPLDRPADAESVVDAAARATRPTVDDMSEWSFPASDPPATWTWETEASASP